MNKSIKKNIRLLSQKFNHSIDYHIDCVFIHSSLNRVKISQEKKYGFKVQYNSFLKNISIDIEKEDVYDIILELLKRTELYELKEKTGFLLNVKKWINEEANDYGKEIIQGLIKVSKKDLIEYENLGGNRIEAEYYKGLIILNDDLCWDKSNVINLKTINNISDIL